MNLYLEAATPSRFELPTMKRHEFDFKLHGEIMPDVRAVVVLKFILNTVKKSILIIYPSRSRHRSRRHARSDHELKRHVTF